MKKFLALMLALLLVVSFAACGEKKEDAKEPDTNNETVVDDNGENGDEGTDAELPEKRDVTEKVTFADFVIKVNGNEVANADLEGLAIYKIEVTTVNSKGNENTNTYCGYVLKDVLDKLGIADPAKVVIVANDGYEKEYDLEMALDDYTLLALEKDKEVGEDATFWIAPCKSGSSGDYTKLAVEVKTE